jgi:ABC-2 type transport system ATP-binding protein
MDTIMPEYAIDIKDLHKSFGKLKVLDGIELAVERGSIVALLGPNGAGKTTIVRILSTLLHADAGTVFVDGFDVGREAKLVRSRIGLTGQYAAVDDYLTGRENLRMMGRLYHLSREDTRRRTEELLKQFDLVDAAGRYARNYSGGMRRRLDLAASLIATPPIIFLDEPTTGLDPRSRLEMWGIIQDLVRQGTTILLTTQQLEEADRLADRIVVIDGGKVIARGTPDELKNMAGSECITFTFNRDRDLHEAARLIGCDPPEIDEKQKSLRVRNERGIGRLRHILQQFEDAGVEVESIALSKPTLDDVFLKLTGHRAAPDETAAREQEGVQK